MLTLLRILMTPVVIVLLLDGRLVEGLAVFVMAGITDGLDGFIARYFHMRTRLGAYLDPLADKLLLMSSLTCLAWMGMVPVWLAVVVVGRDVAVMLGVVTLGIFSGAPEINPSFGSKISTLLQLITVTCVLASPIYALSHNIMRGLYLITALFCGGSGLVYVARGIHMLEDHERK